jgi:integrase
MEWTEVADGVWTLPAARNKTGVDLVRPLSRAAREIIEALPKGGAFVFTTNGTLHDLRRTARSLMSRAGVPTDHAERCLGHVIGGVRGVYDRHEYHREKAEAYEALAGIIERIVSGTQADVVPIRRGKR